MGQLAEANTMLVKAESDLIRIKPLAEMNAVSMSDLDAAVAERDAAKASVMLQNHRYHQPGLSWDIPGSIPPSMAL